MANEYKIVSEEALNALCRAIKNNAINNDGEIIDDENVATDKTYSSLKIQEELDKVFTSVSNGKQLVASAITDKGVDTPIDATFEEMAQNIEKISGGEIIDKEVYMNVIQLAFNIWGNTAKGIYSASTSGVNVMASTDNTRTVLECVKAGDYNVIFVCDVLNTGQLKVNVINNGVEKSVLENATITANEKIVKKYQVSLEVGDVFIIETPNALNSDAKTVVVLKDIPDYDNENIVQLAYNVWGNTSKAVYTNSNSDLNLSNVTNTSTSIECITQGNYSFSFAYDVFNNGQLKITIFNNGVEKDVLENITVSANSKITRGYEVLLEVGDIIKIETPNAQNSDAKTIVVSKGIVVPSGGGEELKPYHVLINSYTMANSGTYEGGYTTDDITITTISATQMKIDFPRNVTKFSYVSHCTSGYYWTVNGVRLTGTEFNSLYFGGTIDIDETTTVTINLSQSNNDNMLSGYFM